ncbi:dTDP-4-amino-4,6-dideoxy-D-glucose transaminase [compost metagenome]
MAPGINGKMSEVNAAFGVLQLKHIDQALAHRRDIDNIYREQLRGMKGIRLIGETGQVKANYSYFPILVEADYPLSRDELYLKLKDNGVFARRYFYPLISELPMYRRMQSAQRSNLPVASEVSEKVLCLPLHPTLEKNEIDRIIEIIKAA